MLTIRVFLSSPGDVAEERRIVAETLRALEDSPLLRERVNLLLVAWDDPVAAAPLDARETPQASINRWAGRPADCDLTIVVLWSRLGTPLPPSLTRADGSRFESGTVWEVEDALSADRPVFIYRRTDKPRIELDDTGLDAKRAQYDAVRAWFDTLRDADGAWRSGVNEYAGTAQFQQMLRAHLEAFIGRQLAPGAPAPTTGAASVAPAPRTLAAAAPGPRSTTPRWLVPVAAGGLLVLGAAFWASRSGSGGPTAPAATLGTSALAPAAGPMAPAAAPATPAPLPAAPQAALPQVRLDGPADVTFTRHRKSTFTVLALAPEAGTSGQWRLRMRVRLASADHSGGMNFSDGSFRLLVDGVPRGPVSNLNEIVEGGAAKDGDIVFDLPWALQSLALRITHYTEVAELPLAVSGTRPPQPAALPVGPRKVTLEGPAELAFARSPRTNYTILALGTEGRRPGVFGLRVRMRMHLLDGAGDNFWDSRFRLLVDGVARAPDSGLNELVNGGEAKDADLTFEVPDGARQLALRVLHSREESADLPLKLEPKP